MAFKYNKGEDNSLIVEDPIYGNIIVPYPFSEIVLTKEMQRLSGISQNGFSQLEFKGLEYNDRLSHSVGAFYVMSLFLKRLEDLLRKYNIELSKDDKDIALCSMLLHDIGHGPFSHTLELVTKYSHEKRTTDILLGDTEVNRVITSFFGQQKVKKIASFIAEINEGQKPPQDSFTILLKNLVSNQLDADRIDYLMRDAYYANKTSAIDLNAIIDSVNVIVNNNGQYELVIDRKGLSSIERVLIERFQMYRDVYLSSASILGDFVFKNIIERYRSNQDLSVIQVSSSFKKLATDPRVSNLSDFVEMEDKDFKDSFNPLAAQSIDLVMAYLCDFGNIKDFIPIKKGVSAEQIKSKLREILGNIDLDRTISIVSSETTTILYKEGQKLNIRDGNVIMDITDCSLIRRQEVLNNTHVFFNPEILRLELGLSPKEFQKYESEIRKKVNELNEESVEFELKYIIEEDDDTILDPDILLGRIISVLNLNGYSVVSTTEKQNNDEYYDTKEMSLYSSGGSLRIRKAEQDGKVKITATYKTPLGEGTVYSSRNEFEETLTDDSFESFRQKMINSGVAVNFDNISRHPMLNSRTQRTDVVLDKNGVQVCLSFDNTLYTNHTYDITVADRMIEIEAKGIPINRNILPEIHNIISSSFKNLRVNKQSKYERGINSTVRLHNYIEQQLTEVQAPVLEDDSISKPGGLVKKMQQS